MRCIIRLATLYLAMTLFEGCSDHTGPTPLIVGSYQVVAVNQHALPATIDHSASDSTQLLSGDLIAADGGTFSTENVEQITNSSGSSVEIIQTHGRYYSEGSAYALADTLGRGIGVVSVFGDTLSALIGDVNYLMVRTRYVRSP